MNEDEEPSREFVRGYNHGYQLAKHEPRLLDQLLQSQAQNAPSDYSRAMAQGKTQYEHEKLVAEMKKAREQRKHTTKIKR